jgi:hypothetical protein
MITAIDLRPIGFWLKLVDRLIDDRFDASLGGLTRRHWQVLNVVHQGASGQAEIDTRLRPFLGEAGTSLREVSDLRARGWIAGTGPLALTEVGAREFERLHGVVSAHRAALMNGIPPEHYGAVVETLERMARNMGWTGA